jgi:hypothetical protein
MAESFYSALQSLKKFETDKKRQFTFTGSDSQLCSNTASVFECVSPQLQIPAIKTIGYSLLGCDSMYSGKRFLTFRRNMLCPSSTLEKESARSIETVINYYETRPRHLQKAAFFTDFRYMGFLILNIKKSTNAYIFKKSQK